MRGYRKYKHFSLKGLNPEELSEKIKIIKSDLLRFREKRKILLGKRKRKWLDYCKEYRSRPEIKERNRLRYKEYSKTEHYKELRRRLQPKESLKRKLKIKNDPITKLRARVRSRFGRIFQRKTKRGSPIRDMGCSPNELKIHLENQFKDGMTWENHGKLGWHIDHIRPLASFDLSKRGELLKACHYTNLQPLWHWENESKKHHWVPKENGVELSRP